MRVNAELRVVRPALGIGQRFTDHPGKSVVAAERGGVDAVFDLDGVGERLGRALADLRCGARHDVPCLGAGLGERSAFGQDPGGQVRVELCEALRRRSDDLRAGDADGRRTLHRPLGLLGCGRTGPGDGLVHHDAGQRDQHRQRVGTPAVGGKEVAQPRLLAQAPMFVSIGPGPAGVLGQRVALRAQGLSPLVTQHGHATAPVTPRVVGHRNRMAQSAALALPARHRM